MFFEVAFEFDICVNNWILLWQILRVADALLRNLLLAPIYNGQTETSDVDLWLLALERLLVLDLLLLLHDLQVLVCSILHLNLLLHLLLLQHLNILLVFKEHLEDLVVHFVLQHSCWFEYDILRPVLLLIGWHFQQIDWMLFHDLGLQVQVNVFWIHFAILEAFEFIPQCFLKGIFGLDFYLFERVEHEWIVIELDIWEVVVAQLLHLDWRLFFVAREAQSEAQALLLTAEKLSFNMLWHELIVEDVILVKEIDELLLMTAAQTLVFILLLDELLRSRLEIEIVVLDQRFLVQVWAQRLGNNWAIIIRIDVD